MAIEGYYAFLLGMDDLAFQALTFAITCWGGIQKRLSDLCKDARAAVEAQPISVGSLVRRWREADAPLENVLTALLAAEPHVETGQALPDRVVTAGIGWGGIELPLVFRFLRQHLYQRNNDCCLIARWSHYRKDGSQPEWDAFPGASTTLDVVRGAVVILFDDNTLTGITLERIRDGLLIHGAETVKMFVGRYSGERREAQMRMTDHGVIDPTLLVTQVGGYLGETPFARSWSVQQYENPIGVFSLSRRRILECIHNNSTVHLYDHEGF